MSVKPLAADTGCRPEPEDEIELRMDGEQPRMDGPIEPIENVRQMVGWNSAAGIGDKYGQIRPVAVGLQRDLPPGRRMREGVGNEISDSPLKERAIQVCFQGIRCFDDKLDAG